MKARKQHKIGVPFLLRGNWYVAKECNASNCCHYCAFGMQHSNDGKACAESVCEPSRRKDGKSVRYKLISGGEG